LPRNNNSNSNKLSVPAAVDSIITHNQAIYTCIKQKLVNYHALASTIRSEIERLTGKPVSTNTIVVAIKRFSDGVIGASGPNGSNKVSLSAGSTLRDAKLTLTNDVAHVTIRPKKSGLPTVVKRVLELSSDLQEPPYLFKLSNLIKLVADEKEYKSLIRSKLDRSHIAKEITGLSKLTLRLSEDAERDSGFALFISELLYRNGIDVIHSYIDEDTIIIVNKEDGPRAYDVIEREIVRSEEEEEQQRPVAVTMIRNRKNRRRGGGNSRGS
jgi:hypothetical protein